MPTSQEYDLVELPLIHQLQAMGWDYLEGDTGVPYLTERENFRQVLLKERLEKAVTKLNLDESGNPWLDQPRITQAVSQLERLSGVNLMEENQKATRLLIKGTYVAGSENQHPVPVKYIDFEHPEQNDFLAINQFRVDPPWAAGNLGYIVPDIVLFVNGIPLVVIEAKSPWKDNPITDAVDQLLRYSNQRPNVDEPEGAERLFRDAQLMVATCLDDARLGAVGADHKYYLAWKDPFPYTIEQVGSELELPIDDLKLQHILTAGSLRPEHLLDILKDFTLFDQRGDEIIKIVPRYQQYRAVHKAIENLQKNGRERSGIIWHTQGSGKSLSMVFLIRKMRSTPELRRYKIVLITDRTKLEDQLLETADLVGEPLQRAGSINEFMELLAQPGAGMVFGMIQKMQGEFTGEGDDALNTSEEILLLIDEAHRSHTSTMHARLMAALPNAVKIGFTGTPILDEDKQPTHDIFGGFIDLYTLAQSQQDGMTVPIFYEGRQVVADILNGDSLDELVAENLSEYDADQIQEIIQNFATEKKVLEAWGFIRPKSRDMLRHYVTTVMPDGFKAQVVAVSRKAAVRYQQAFEEAQIELIEELETIRQLPETNRRRRELEGALPYLDRIKRMKFAAVISGDQQDPPSYRQWTQKGRQDAYVADFKKGFSENDGNTAILIVVSMLLTGFDAPREQAMYIDKKMEGYELLQAIARVNRTYPNKEHGLIVDYIAIANHLKHALDVYSASDIPNAVIRVDDMIPLLRDRFERVATIFVNQDLSLDDTEGCVQLLEDARTRARFQVTHREFRKTLNSVLPRPAALPFVDDAKKLDLIRLIARNRYRDQNLDIAGAEAKVEQLIDEYVIAQGVDPKIPPLDILDAEFEEHVGTIRSPRAQAAEMEHAIRFHIRQHIQEDPVYYQRLSERLEEILQSLEDKWEEQVRALREIIRSYMTTQQAMNREERRIQPFHRLLLDAVQQDDLPQEQIEKVPEISKTLVDLITLEISNVDFWRQPVAQDRLRGQIMRFLDDHDLVPFEEQAQLADLLLQTARANHSLLVSIHE
jgi:type I restriction enzyme R subunit